MSTTSRIVITLVTVCSLGLALSACSSPGSSTSPAASTSAASAPTTATPTQTPTATGDSIPFQQDCNNMIPAQFMFQWNPNYSLNNEAPHAPGSSWDLVGQLNGTNCNYVNQSSNNAITISVAHLTPSGLSIVEDQVSSVLQPADANEKIGKAFFGKVAGSGVYEFFATNDFWVTIAGPDVSSPQDVKDLEDVVLQYLPWG